MRLKANDTLFIIVGQMGGHYYPPSQYDVVDDVIVDSDHLSSVSGGGGSGGGNQSLFYDEWSPELRRFKRAVISTIGNSKVLFLRTVKK